MNSLLIAGAGGHGQVVAETAQAMGKWKQISFLDDRYDVLDGTLAFPVLGGMENAFELRHEYADIIVAVGNATTRLALLNRFDDEGFHLPSLIHPAAWLSPTATLAEGCVLFAQTAVNAGAVMGRGVIVNTGATVDHNCCIEQGVHICPGVHMAGNVVVGEKSWIGIGASILQQVRIGKNVVVGGGAAVLNDVHDGITVVGVPAKVLDRSE